jgi:tetratricopeptide (TPR) repeat protein
MFGFLSTKKGQAGDITGNAVLGDVTGHLTQNFFADAAQVREPMLPWRELPDDPNAVFRLLSWRARLVPLIGREKEKDALLNWTREKRQISVRILSGPGGAGKTRLAADFAQQLRELDWTAGFVSLAEPMIVPVRQRGLLLLIDYPEEQPENVVALLRNLAATEAPPAPVRVLLLSRQPSSWWQKTIDSAGAADIVDEQDFGVERLVQENAISIFFAGLTKLAEHFGSKPVATREEDVRQWIDRNAALHALPLFITAAAIHTFQEPAVRLGIDGGAIVLALVRRERARVDRMSESAGLGPDGASRLLALAAVRGRLQSSDLERLAAPALGMGLPSSETIIDCIRKTPWWNGVCLPAPTPDILAAAFLLEILKEREDRAPDWLWAVMPGAIPEFLERLARLSYDIVTVFGPEQGRFEQWLVQIVKRDTTRAAAFASVASAEIPYNLASFAAAVFGALLAERRSDEERATYLNNLSNHLINSGDGKAALEAIREAVEIRRRLAAGNLARFDPDLAGSLNNFSRCLSNVGERKAALEAGREAVGIWRRLAAEDPARFSSSLASSLNNLSNHLTNVGEKKAALETIREAVEIRRRLAAENPARFNPVLATNLVSLANCLGDVEEEKAALEASREAVGLWRRLAAENPARFTPALATSLNNVSNRLAHAGEGKAALEYIHEAVGIRRRLAAENPARFNPDLASSLHNLSGRLYDSGEGKAAREAIDESIELLRVLAKTRPVVFIPMLQESLRQAACLRREANDERGAHEAEAEANALVQPDTTKGEA